MLGTECSSLSCPTFNQKVILCFFQNSSIPYLLQSEFVTVLCTVCLFKMFVPGALSYNFTNDLALHIYCVPVHVWQFFHKHDKSIEASHITHDKKRYVYQYHLLKHHFSKFLSSVFKMLLPNLRFKPVTAFTQGRCLHPFG